MRQTALLLSSNVIRYDAGHRHLGPLEAFTFDGVGTLFESTKFVGNLRFAVGKLLAKIGVQLAQERARGRLQVPLPFDGVFDQSFGKVALTARRTVQTGGAVEVGVLAAAPPHGNGVEQRAVADATSQAADEVVLTL